MNSSSLGKLVEKQRLEERTNYDLDMLRNAGFCLELKNYSRHLSGRAPREQPPTLLEYFPEDHLKIDESHVTLPQVLAMYKGDRSRKQTLVDYGFLVFRRRWTIVLCNRKSSLPYPIRPSLFQQHLPI